MKVVNGLIMEQGKILKYGEISKLVASFMVMGAERKLCLVDLRVLEFEDYELKELVNLLLCCTDGSKQFAVEVLYRSRNIEALKLLCRGLLEEKERKSKAV